MWLINSWHLFIFYFSFFALGICWKQLCAGRSKLPNGWTTKLRRGKMWWSVTKCNVNIGPCVLNYIYTVVISWHYAVIKMLFYSILVLGLLSDSSQYSFCFYRHFSKSQNDWSRISTLNNISQFWSSGNVTERVFFIQSSLDWWKEHKKPTVSTCVTSHVVGQRTCDDLRPWPSHSLEGMRTGNTTEKMYSSTSWDAEEVTSHMQNCCFYFCSKSKPLQPSKRWYNPKGFQMYGQAVWQSKIKVKFV